MANSATLTFGYKDTDFTRQYTFDNLTEEQCTGLKAKVQAFNASLEAGTAGGLSAFFISDDFDAEEDIGYLTGIVEAYYKAVTVTDIPLS